jgi:hypothetical protein
MDEQTRDELARRGTPYGLATVPETNPAAPIDEQHERAIQQRWQRICERHGAAILGIRDVLTSPREVQLDGIRWELGPLGTDERTVPAEVFHRVRALEAAGVPFGYWLWGEELPQRPNLRPLAEPTPTASGSDWPSRQRDPLLIGVIPTAPGRGLWVLLGRWFH